MIIISVGANIFTTIRGEGGWRVGVEDERGRTKDASKSWKLTDDFISKFHFQLSTFLDGASTLSRPYAHHRNWHWHAILFGRQPNFTKFDAIRGENRLYLVSRCKIRCSTNSQLLKRKAANLSDLIEGISFVNVIVLRVYRSRNRGNRVGRIRG